MVQGALHPPRPPLMGIWCGRGDVSHLEVQGAQALGQGRGDVVQLVIGQMEELQLLQVLWEEAGGEAPSFQPRSDPRHHPNHPLPWQLWAKTSQVGLWEPGTARCPLPAPAPTRKASGWRPVLGILLRRASSLTMLRGSSGSAVSLFSGRMSSCRLGRRRKASASAQAMELLVRSIRFSFSGGREKGGGWRRPTSPLVPPEAVPAQSPALPLPRRTQPHEIAGPDGADAVEAGVEVGGVRRQQRDALQVGVVAVDRGADAEAEQAAGEPWGWRGSSGLGTAAPAPLQPPSPCRTSLVGKHALQYQEHSAQHLF